MCGAVSSSSVLVLGVASSCEDHPLSITSSEEKRTSPTREENGFKMWFASRASKGATESSEVEGGCVPSSRVQPCSWSRFQKSLAELPPTVGTDELIGDEVSATL